jgi:glycerol-3-phosphate dehydrogenase (NAD(P)+)
METGMSRIAVIGAGAWGTGLAIVLGRGGRHQVRLWAHEKEVRDSILARRENELFLPGVSIPATVLPTGSLQEALDGAEIVVGVTPSQHCRHLFQQMFPFLKPELLFVSATKGLEEETLLRMTEVAAQVIELRCGFAPRIGALSGPSFAKEVARGDPTAITVASKDSALA